MTRRGWLAGPVVAIAAVSVIATLSLKGASAQTSGPLVTASTTATVASAIDPEIAQGKCPAAIRQSPTCFQLRSYSDTRLLGTLDPTDLDSYLTQGQTDTLSPPTTYWEVLPVGDGKVRFHDLGVDRCLGVYSNSRVYLDECQSAAAADENLLHPRRRQRVGALSTGVGCPADEVRGPRRQQPRAQDL